MGSGVLEMRHTIDIHTKNKVHPTAVIDDGVVMGVGNYVGPCLLYTSDAADDSLV